MGEKSWLRRRIKDGLHRGFQHAYETVKVDPARFLLQLRAAYGLPITNLQGVYSVEITRLDDLATRFIRSGMKVAAVEGAGLPGAAADHCPRSEHFSRNYAPHHP